MVGGKLLRQCAFKPCVEKHKSARGGVVVQFVLYTAFFLRFKLGCCVGGRELEAKLIAGHKALPAWIAVAPCE